MGQVKESTGILINSAFGALLENTKDMMFVKDINLVYVVASMPFVRMVGKERVEDIVGRTDLDIFEDKSLAKRYISDDHKLLDGGKNLIDYIEPITDEDSHARYGSTSKYILKDSEGNNIGILGITRDITRDYIARQQYQKELQYLFELPEDTYAVSYIDVDDWRIISQRKQNIGECTLETCYTVEDLCMAAVEAIIDRECKAAVFYREFSSENMRHIFESGRHSLAFKYRRLLPDGTQRWVHNEIRFLIDADSGHLCAMLTAKDINAQKKAEQELAMAAKMDKMTMLLNRETTMKSIRETLEEEHDLNHVLYMIDVDNFKILNDTMGHQKGDEFLISLAKVIRDNFADGDIVGRVGGDEFFALMRDVSDMGETETVAEKLLTDIHTVCVNYPGINLSASIGISKYPENAKTLEELYATADGALYQAKGSGKNKFVFASRC